MLEAEQFFGFCSALIFLDLYFLFEILNDKQCDKMYYFLIKKANTILQWNKGSWFLLFVSSFD